MRILQKVLILEKTKMAQCRGHLSGRTVGERLSYQPQITDEHCKSLRCKEVPHLLVQQRKRVVVQSEYLYCRVVEQQQQQQGGAAHHKQLDPVTMYKAAVGVAEYNSYALRPTELCDTTNVDVVAEAEDGKVPK